MSDTLTASNAETVDLVEAIRQQNVNIAQLQIQASAFHGNVDPSEYNKLARLYELMGMHSKTMPELSHRINTEAGEAASAAIENFNRNRKVIETAQRAFNDYRDNPNETNLEALRNAWYERTRQGIYPAVLVNPPRGSGKEPIVYYNETTHLPLSLQLVDAGKLDEKVNAYTIGFLVRVNIKGKEKLVLIVSVWGMVDTDSVKTQDQDKGNSPAVMVKTRYLTSSSPLDIDPHGLKYDITKGARAYISPDDGEIHSPKYVIRTSPEQGAEDAIKQAQRPARRKGRDT